MLLLHITFALNLGVNLQRAVLGDSPPVWYFALTAAVINLK